ncbi:chymotrypsin-1 [Aedes aegypti]|uniref:Uncharacterized protein n=1 Tax=Aedes aegypti TaxID=7159 RepID=A0A1S4FDB1_AEDAE|nr:chymotrypsin-1 [Aedes aegypti]
MGNTKITWAVTALLVHVVSATGVNPFIVGGVPATLGEFPAQVGIHIGPTVFCGGTILNSNHILTAGSCVLDGQNNLIAANQMQVRAGVITIDATNPTTQVDRVFVHPHYNPFTFENDIAILRTTTAFTFPETAQPHIAPVELNHKIVPENSECEVAGWNWQAGSTTTALQRLLVSIYPRAYCNQVYNGMIQRQMICSTTASQNQALCVANRGGGLYYGRQLSGIASFGFGCGANNTAVFTQIRYYEQWIQQQFARTDNPPPGPTPMPGIGGGSTMLNLSMVALLLATIIITLVR